MLGDIGQLVSAITTAGGGARLMLFAAPNKAALLPIYAAGTGLLDVVPTPALAPGTVVAIDPQAFVSGFGADPQIDISREATIHYEDTTPLHLGDRRAGLSGCSPPRPARMFQTYTLALRLILRWPGRSARRAWCNSCRM